MEPTLDEFLKNPKPYANNSYVTEPGWKSLYVRRTSRYTNGLFRHLVLDLANIEAEKPGHGAFRALVSRLRRDYPKWTLYVESVLSKQFIAGLEKMGFHRVGGPFEIEFSPNFYLAPEDQWPATKP